MNSPNRPITTTEFIANELRKDILSGKIKSKERLRQNEISANFGVSQTPVREALKLLTAEGLVSFDSYKGAIVRELCYKDAKEIYDLRILLEPILIENGFKNFEQKFLDEAYAIQEKIENCTDVNEWAILNDKFHNCFWKSEINSRLFSIVEGLKTAAMSYVSLSLIYKHDHIALSNIAHRAILEACMERDLPKLIKLSVEHTDQTRDILEDVIKNVV
ncbi:GntR family transcriptional regulator [Campylobacter sp. faydin G-24]|uniref:GntR family transcriptional regulator n=1 Tax=Campylobacter anatolicus TaxID=2829105 RepID=A0ABS5HHK6_9BACT|nr:GntR family transcriptional regulator [Campylobacter anatolicus]MBR8462119.1 GntR family transcriptional regulator [Campylobacter anatolicus]MBR8463763.1 GntR family transcriptional regulator [Campylobacter anatolicus]MBR8464795.1 GntR family transcriptional regulator [Campylobacter anatolicus]